MGGQLKHGVWAWVIPLLAVAIYALIAHFVFNRVRTRYRTRTTDRLTATGALLGDALGWPLILALVAVGLAILSESWPLGPRGSRALNAAEHLLLIAGLTLLAQRWLGALYHFSKPDSWLRITLLRKIALSTLYVVAALMALQVLRLPLTPLLTSLGIGSLAVALAVREILANFFAGIQLAVDRPLEIGQTVTLETGMTGEVVALDWMKTHLRAADGSRIIVPNTRMIGFIIQNLSMSHPQAVLTLKLPISRASDLERAEQVAIETARELMREAGQEPEGNVPAAYFTQLGAASAELTVMLGFRQHAETAILRSRYLKTVSRRLKEAGVEMA